LLLVVGVAYFYRRSQAQLGEADYNFMLGEAGLVLQRNDVTTARSHLFRALKAGAPMGEVGRVLSEQFARVRRDQRTHSTFNLTLAAAYLSHTMGEHTTALQYYLEADRFAHSDWQVPYRIGELLSGGKYSLEAAEAYNKSALLRPARAKTWLRSAIDFKSAGRLAKAAEQGWHAVHANKSWYKPYVFLHYLQIAMPEREDLKNVLQQGRIHMQMLA